MTVFHEKRVGRVLSYVVCIYSSRLCVCFLIRNKKKKLESKNDVCWGSTARHHCDISFVCPPRSPLLTCTTECYRLAMKLVSCSPSSLPRAAKQEGCKTINKTLCSIGKKRNERPFVGGVYIRSRNGAQTRKGCVVNGQTSEAADK